MKKRIVLTWAAAASAVVLTGCVNPDGSPNSAGTGALVGGAFGAFTGAAMGGRWHGGPDALMGAAAGALTGGLIGLMVDHDRAERLKAEAPQTYQRVDTGQPLTVGDVEALARAGVTEDTIINQIEASHTVFHLTAGDIIALRDAGVSDKVVNYMISTPSTVGATAETTSGTTTYIPQAPPPPPVETMVVAPAPGYVWIGGEWVWNGGWFWVGGHWAFPPYPHAVWLGGRVWHDSHGWHNARGHWH